VQQGAVVTTEVNAAAPPEHIGGALADGTYVLTAFNFYGPVPVPPATFQATVEKTGGAMSFLWNRPGEESRVSYTIMASGVALTMAETCRFSVPASAPQPPVTFEYTANPTGFRLYLEAKGGGEAEMVFTKK
jgi:hypothetical protein